MGVVPRYTQDPVRSTNVTIKQSLLALIPLLRQDYKGGLSEFICICLVAYQKARLREKRRLTEVELEVAITEARVKEADATIALASAAKDLDAARLLSLQDELDKTREQLAQARRLELTVEQIVDLAWGPPGEERRARLRKLAELHGHPIDAVMRAASERHKRETDARIQQANLRALPRGGRQ